MEKLERAAEKKPSVRGNLQALKEKNAPVKAAAAKQKAAPEAAL